MKTAAATLAALTVGTALLLPAAPATATGASSLHLTVKKFCKDDGTTRVRVRVENTGSDRSVNYSVRYSDGRSKWYTGLVEKQEERRVLIGATVPTDGTVEITVGPSDDDTYSGYFDRTFSPLAC